MVIIELLKDHLLNYIDINNYFQYHLIQTFDKLMLLYHIYIFELILKKIIHKVK